MATTSTWAKPVRDEGIPTPNHVKMRCRHVKFTADVKYQPLTNLLCIELTRKFKLARKIEFFCCVNMWRRSY